MTTTETRTYTVHAERDDNGWVVTVPEVPGAITQVRRLDQVADDAIEVIEIQTGERVTRSQIVIVPVFDDDVTAAAVVATAQERRQHASDATKDAAEATKDAVRVLYDRGFTVRDIGSLIGITHQRAHQLVNP